MTLLSEIKPTIVFLSTYPPRECGIATFTQDLFRSSQKITKSGLKYKVAAFNLSPLDTYTYPREVKWEIDQNNKNDYITLARTMNEDKSIVGIILQHEYGIFGGPEGEKILYFMRTCKKPILVTLHTTLPIPPPKMKEVTTEIVKLASNIVVLTKRSKEIIVDVYPKSRGKIYVIPHGIHPIPFALQDESKDKLDLSDHIVLSTFGLLSRGKGIEYAIKALPPVIKKYPSLLYLILGETHPVIRRNEGEKYRLELARLITKMKLKKHVRFYDQYLSLPDLLEFLQATDIYISTSINPNQAVSGTLSYALGTGRAVISTEFAQAKEIVIPKIGKVVPIKNSETMTSAIMDLLSDTHRLHEMDRNAYKMTRPMQWNNVALEYTHLLIRTIVPPLNLRHLRTMTDEMGLFQFASHALPNKDLGYTLDDNARALIVCSWLIEHKVKNKVKSLIATYLAFMKKCQKEDGSFMNYIGYEDKTPTYQNKQEDLEETQSRAMWALSEIMDNRMLPPRQKNVAKKIFLKGLTNALYLSHPRAQAHAIKSFTLVLKHLPNHTSVLNKCIKKYADSLIHSLDEHSIKDWTWFESSLKYNNALLSESLLIAGESMKNTKYATKGIQTLQFLIKKTFTPDMYIPIGHSNWYKNKEKRSQYDQQPEDPASMILALVRAYEYTQNTLYKNLAKNCFSWFLGNNSIGESLYVEETGGCYDGLHPDRVNLNQGAESLVSYLMASTVISHLT